VKARPYYFEIKDMVAQFVAAFDDIVIGRFNKNREEEDRINVRYLYAPKQRVMHDIVNLNKTITIPAVAVSVSSISRDPTRVFNKLDGFYYSANSEGQKAGDLYSRHIKTPIPINLELNVSILARYQTDIDQILSNFVPFCNPYVIISWYLPKEFNTDIDQEIRSEVLWGGNVAMSYPIELTGAQKARVTADTTFTIKGWLFKDEDQPAGNIFYIDQNFVAESHITEYESMTGADLSGYTTESFETSASPYVTGLFVNGVRLQEPIVYDTLPSDDLEISLEGMRFNLLDGLILSASNTNSLTSVDVFDQFTRQGAITGQQIDYTVNSENSISLTLPTSDDLEGTFAFVPYNSAGWDTSVNSYLSATAPEGDDGRGNKPIYIEFL
jgi:hypothetical protein